MMSSRCRTTNFSLKERCVFIELLVKNYPFLHEDKGHSRSTNDIRSTAWNDLTNDFHFQLRLVDKNTYRTTKQLKTLYENIKHKIKRNIGQGSMQADVKTAKDIPLSFFLQLKSQYEVEMGKIPATEGLKCGSHSYATGRDTVVEEGKRDYQEFAAGHPGCGEACKCRSYLHLPSSKQHKKSPEGHGFKPGANVEKWVNSKGDRIVILDQKTVLMEEGGRGEQPRKSIVLANLPRGIGVRYPRNLSRNIYNLSDSSDDEQTEVERGMGDGGIQGSSNRTIGSCGNGVVTRIGNMYKVVNKNGIQGSYIVRENNGNAYNDAERNKNCGHIQTNGKYVDNFGRQNNNYDGNQMNIVNQYSSNGFENNKNDNHMSFGTPNGQNNPQCSYQNGGQIMNGYHIGRNQNDYELVAENKYNNGYHYNQYEVQMRSANQVGYNGEKENRSCENQMNVKQSDTSEIDNKDQLNYYKQVAANEHNAIEQIHNEEELNEDGLAIAHSTSDDTSVQKRGQVVNGGAFNSEVGNDDENNVERSAINDGENNGEFDNNVESVERTNAEEQSVEPVEVKNTLDI